VTCKVRHLSLQYPKDDALLTGHSIFQPVREKYKDLSGSLIPTDF